MLSAALGLVLWLDRISARDCAFELNSACTCN
jgi:hypothetical protein